MIKSENEWETAEGAENVRRGSGCGQIENRAERGIGNAGVDTARQRDERSMQQQQKEKGQGDAAISDKSTSYDARHSPGGLITST
jgi:hypothetical protein